MKYKIILLSIALLSVSYLITESESAYAMKTVNSNWSHPGFSFVDTTPTHKEANQVLRDSKATSFVPTFRHNTISENHEMPDRNHNRSHHTVY